MLVLNLNFQGILLQHFK